MPSREDILAVIMGGGRGARLYPLTKLRSKPAVPIAGKYRLIDIPISNCINSHIFQIAVLTQFNSVSLHRHITNTYQFDPFHTGYVQIWAAAEQTMSGSDWYQGTADAVRKQIFEIQSTRAKYVLILSGDHLYRMDYARMAQFHWDNKADITVAVQPVPREDAPRLGILKADANHRITRFAEKPKDPALQDEMVSEEGSAKPFLGSMGIYMFDTAKLVEILEKFPDLDDFGNHIIPNCINQYGVFGYNFGGYWVDIGTVRSFYDTNLALTLPAPPFNFWDLERPIYSRSRFLPGSIIQNSSLTEVLLTEGCTIHDAVIERSVIGVRSQIGAAVKITDSVLMGADYYDPGSQNRLPVGIGPETTIQGAIIDKNARIGKGVVIKPFPRGFDHDGGDWVVRDGIVTVAKNVTLPDGTILSPETIKL